ncbi:MAG: CHAT domain-containing protein [Ardenticatenales bacterium]|nr:CHAT domain-containing protein [Ardenticatenales bacterium]
MTISEHLLTDEFKLSFAHGLNRVNQEWINTTYHFFQTSGEEIVPTLVAINLTNLATASMLGPRISKSQSMLVNEHTALRQNWIQLRLEQDPLFSSLDGQAPESGHTANNKQLLLLEKQLLDTSRLVSLTCESQDIKCEPFMDDYYSYFDNLTIARDEIAQVQYFQANEEIHAVVFDSSGTRVNHCLASMGFLRRLLKAWRMAIRGRGVTENTLAQKTMLVTFYEKLVRPLELENINQLYFVPLPELHDLPLHACHDGSSFLAQKTRISYINFPFSIDDEYFSGFFNVPNKQPSALVGSYSMHQKLPHTRDECLKVADLLRKQDAEVYCFPETLSSRELEIEGKYADIIHLSAHGDYRKDNSIFSSIHLSDGPLSALQVGTMAFEKRPLLVLNACSTGSGSRRAGALQGIVRSFLMSGARFVIANQWEIEDEDASIFMQEFYERLRVGNVNPGKTLQETQSKLINQGASINEWGSYVCWQDHQRGKGE